MIDAAVQFPLVAAPKRMQIKMEKHKIPVLFCARLDVCAEEICRYFAGALSWFCFGQAKKNKNVMDSRLRGNDDFYCLVNAT